MAAACCAVGQRILIFVVLIICGSITNNSNDAYWDCKLQFLGCELWISIAWSCSWRPKITSLADKNVMGIVTWWYLVKQRNVNDVIITISPQKNFQLAYYINFQYYLRIHISTTTQMTNKVTEWHRKVVGERNWGGSKAEGMSWHERSSASIFCASVGDIYRRGR